MKLYLLLFIAIGFAACNRTQPKKEARKKPASNLRQYADVIYAEQKDPLYRIGGDGSNSGYLKYNGDTVIPVGKYSMIFTDTFRTYAFVYDKVATKGKMVAINRNDEIIFDAYLFDNGPDYTAEGLFRIIRNGKIGYADENGEVVISAKYGCAFPFENGKAKVAVNCKNTSDGEHTSAESDEWIYIDRDGKTINQ